MNSDFGVFRSCPLFRDPSDYLSWLEKIEKNKSQVWKEMGIFELIQLLKIGPSYSQTMLLSSLYFWDSSHHTFHLPCSMMMPILFDITAITWLKPMGETYDLDFLSKDIIGFDTSRVSFTRTLLITMIKILMKFPTLSILLFWLCGCLAMFFVRSISK